MTLLFLVEVETALCQYFTENSFIINQAAHKATICGKLIQIASRAKRTREQTFKQQDEDS